MNLFCRFAWELELEIPLEGLFVIFQWCPVPRKQGTKCPQNFRKKIQSKIEDETIRNLFRTLLRRVLLHDPLGVHPKLTAMFFFSMSAGNSLINDCRPGTRCI